MMLSTLYTFLAVATLVVQTFAEPLNLSPKSLVKKDDSRTRVLKAVNVRSDIQRRQVDFKPKITWDHHYADHDSLLCGASARFAKTSMSFKLPTLALENIENNLENIECSKSTIVLEFVHENVLQQAKKEWDKLSEFIIISSHPGCNRDGERAPYLVSRISYEDDGITAVISVGRLEWKAAYASMEVGFGMTGESHGDQYTISGIRSHRILHQRLGRRQETTSTSSTIVYPMPTSTPTAESSLNDITKELVNPSLISLTGTQNNLAGQLTVGCKNCSTAGTIEITQGLFIVNSSATTVYEEAINFIEQGFFSLVANDVNVRVELENSISISKEFSHRLFTFNLAGFQIPGIASIGPELAFELAGSFEISNAVDFSYGFNLAIPHNSSVTFNIGNLNESTSQGFSNSSITATPFGASSDGLSLSLSLGLRAALLIGVNVLSGSGDIHAGIFLDLPKLSVGISSRSNSNSHCETPYTSNPLDFGVSQIFPSLTHIVPMANISIGLEAGAALQVPLMPLPAIQTLTTTDLIGTGYALETACFSWDANAKAYVTPSISTLSMSATATGAGGAAGAGSLKGNSGRGLRDGNPLAQWRGTVVVTTVVVLVLL